MNAAELYARLASLGVQLVAAGGQLRVSATRGILTKEMQESIATRKAELLELLEDRSSAPVTDLIKVSRGGALPLSFFQERLWILHRLDPDSTAYNLATVWPGAGLVDAARLVNAIRGEVQRHEILRAAFRGEAGAPRVHLFPPDAVSIELHDLRDLSEPEQSTTIGAARIAETSTPFDLATEPPVRFRVYRVASDRATTLVVAHHIAIDAWSFSLLRREIAAAYVASSGAVQAPRFQYADYAAWQRHTQDPDQLAAQLEWWERNLAGIPQLCAFSPDLLPTATRAEGSTRVFPWNAELSGAFRLLVREEGTTVYMGLLAAFAVVLQAHTGLNDIVLGSPMGIRERPEFETMIGPFVNLLVLRLNLTDDPTFVELLGRARDAVLDAHAHREVPFEMLIERLRPVRTFTRSPLFQVAVVQHNASSDHAEAISAGGAIHDMTWFVREVEDGFEGAIEFRTDLYAAETIDRIDAHLGAVLLAAVRDRRCRISEISLLTSLERQHVVEKFNATAAETDGATFAVQFERQAAVTAEACAVRFESAELTYGALNRRANQLARRLRFLGIGPGVLVGLSLERSLDMVVALLGIQKAGGAYVPLDPDLPKERLEFMLVDSGVAVLVTAGETGSGLDIPEGMYLLDLEAEAAALDGMDATNPDGFVGPQDVAYVIYTSGSTGRPKGVAVSHGALSNFLGAMKRAPTLAASDVLAATTTISFDIAALELYLPLLVGARVELISREMAADGAALAEQLSVSGVTVLQATPVMWRQLVDVGWRGRQGFRALCGGETLPRDLADALLERVQELWNLFGPTETTIWSTAERVERGTEPISIGRPIANTQIYILDHAGEPAPIGIPGEIWIGGAGVATRYHRRPELTAERFVPDRFTSQPGARLYRTGDLGRWGADGRLYHLGRLDHQLKIHGIRIEPGEIETVLRAHSAVRQAVIIAREVGPGSRRLVAYVVYEAGKDLTVSEVRGYLRGKLPDYMVPSVVVTLDSVPLTPNGKVDRMSLPDPFKNTLRTAASREPPAPGTEQQIAQIWQDILRIDRISAEDNFFELGGHSLLSLRVAAAVEKQIGCRMDPRTLFFQTLRQVATGVRRDATAARARGR